MHRDPNFPFIFAPFIHNLKFRSFALVLTKSKQGKRLISRPFYSLVGCKAYFDSCSGKSPQIEGELYSRQSRTLQCPLHHRWINSYPLQWLNHNLCYILVLLADNAFFLFSFFCLNRLRILASQSGIEHVPPAVEAPSLNYWTTREVYPCQYWRKLRNAFASHYLACFIHIIQNHFGFRRDIFWLT